MSKYTTYITPEQARYNAQHQEEYEMLLAEVETCIIKDNQRGAYWMKYATDDRRGAEYVQDKLTKRGFKVELVDDEDRGYGLPMLIIRVSWENND